MTLMTIDLYLLATPLLLIITLLNLITLKLSLKTTLPKQKQLQSNLIVQHQTIKSICCFLMKNYTLAEIILVRKSNNKIPLFMTISIVAVLVSFKPSYYYFSIIGIIVSVLMLIGHMLITTSQNNESIKSCNLQIMYSILVLSSSMLLLMLSIIIYYKNYKNKLIQTFLISLISNLSIDFCLIQPISYFLISFLLGKFSIVHQYITLQNIKQQLNLKQNQIKSIDIIYSPKKRKLSPSKIPKSLLNVHNLKNTEQLHFQIQPIQSNNNNQQETFKIAIQMSKKIKKQRQIHLPINNTNLTPNNKKNNTISQQGDFDTINNTQHHFKSITPISQIPQKNIYLESIINKFQDDTKYNQRKSINQILGSYSQHINDSSKIVNKVKFNSNTLSPTNSNAHKKNQNQNDENSVVLILPKKTLNKQQIDIREDQFQTIQNHNLNLNYMYKNFNKFHLDNDQQSEQNDTNGYNSKKKSSIDQQISHNSQSKKNSLLQIRQDFNGQIEEIDKNSSQKYARKAKKIEEGIQEAHIKKRSLRKYSTTKRRIVKFTSGQPYLQYLPHLLSKQLHLNHKRSQPIVKKDQSSFFDRNKKKSVRRLKNTKDPIVRQNQDQNECPQFYIQDL